MQNTEIKSRHIIVLIGFIIVAFLTFRSETYTQTLSRVDKQLKYNNVSLKIELVFNNGKTKEYKVNKFEKAKEILEIIKGRNWKFKKDKYNNVNFNCIINQNKEGEIKKVLIKTLQQ